MSTVYEFLGCGLLLWRQLDKFILCGHSMGALYGTYYASKYPNSVEHVILVSPAGVHASSLAHSDLPLGRRIAYALHLTPMVRGGHIILSTPVHFAKTHEFMLLCSRQPVEWVL